MHLSLGSFYLKCHPPGICMISSWDLRDKLCPHRAVHGVILDIQHKFCIMAPINLYSYKSMIWLWSYEGSPWTWDRYTLCYFMVLLRKKFFKSINLFIIYFSLCWVFVSVQGLSLVVASRGHSSSWCTGLSLSWPLLLRSTGSRRAGSVVVAHGPRCSVACGIFPDQGSNPCPLHWQADSQPLRHQGSPRKLFKLKYSWFKMC